MFAYRGSLRQLSPLHPLLADDSGIYLSQDAYFLGFPYGLRADIGVNNNNFPVPFVKKCIISMFLTGANGVRHYYLDGHNNPGFSGGPVVYVPPGERDLKVCAVISAFRFEEAPIYKGDQETQLAYRYNTGIIVSYGIRHAQEVIQSNPTGFLLS